MCIRVKIVSAVVVLILFSPIFTTDGYVNTPTEDLGSEVEYNFGHNEIDKAEKLLSNAPQAITANYGQLGNDEVLFYDQGGAVWFTADGVWYEVRDELSMTSLQSIVDSPDLRLTTNDYRLTTYEYRRVVLKQEFIGANHVLPIGRERLSWNSNFFYGNDSSKWCTNVPNYAEVWYKNIYDGIDLRYYTFEKGLKYDFIIHPGGNPLDIRINWEGSQKLILDPSGDLIIRSIFGDIVDSDIFMYQNIDNSKLKIDGKFKIFDDEYGFDIIDEYRNDRNLIIDPGLQFSTFIGGNGYDYGVGIKVDSNGDVIVSGQTTSSNFPTTPGAYNTSQSGSYDFFVLKLNSNCSKLIYSTFVGGSNQELHGGLDIDSNGNAVIGGQSFSSDYPTTNGAFDTTFNGARDGVVFKLNQNG